MNKSKVLLAVGLVLSLVGSSANAAPGVRGAKAAVAIPISTVVTGVSSGAAVLYSVILGTGAVTDFVALFDSATVTGISGASLGGNFRMRVYATSATQNTIVTFDPPIQFNNGIIAVNATAVMSTLITFEKGRVSGGY